MDKLVENPIVGIDIGASKISAIIGEVEESGNIKVICNCEEALEIGVASDLQTTVETLKKVVNDLEKVSGIDVDNVFVGVSTTTVRVVSCTGQTIIETGEVRQTDIENAVRSASVISSPSDEIIHTFRVHFKLDDNPEEYNNPLGMSCNRLTAVVNIVLMPRNVLDNRRKCIEQANLTLEGFVLEPYAAGLSVLTPEEVELGVAVLDIGAQYSEMAVFKGKNKFVSQSPIWHTAVLACGGTNVTNDITRSFKCPIAMSQAEKIKIEEGTCRMTNLIQDAEFKVQAVGSLGETLCSKKQLAEVMQNRFAQIFQAYASRLKQFQLLDKISGGIVLTGGCASIDGIDKLAEIVMTKYLEDNKEPNNPSKIHISVRCAKPESKAGWGNAVAKPSLAVCMGLLEYGARERMQNSKSTRKQPIVAMKSWGQRIMDFFKSMFTIN